METTKSLTSSFGLDVPAPGQVAIYGTDIIAIKKDHKTSCPFESIRSPENAGQVQICDIEKTDNLSECSFIGFVYYGCAPALGKHLIQSQYVGKDETGNESVSHGLIYALDDQQISDLMIDWMNKARMNKDDATLRRAGKMHEEILQTPGFLLARGMGTEVDNRLWPN
ncbi:MAG: hypothetical protein MRY79_04935 [Alphaproteobacteria bacterium]|nr:hypothetical protein [Alphaproteobacteria bacterium]